MDGYIDVDKSTELWKYFMRTSYSDGYTTLAYKLLETPNALNDKNLRQELLDFYDELPTHESFDEVDR